MTPVTMNMKPVVLAMKVGNMGDPTTLCSVLPFPPNWVCFCLTSSPRWAARSPMRMSGMISTCRMKKREDDDPVPRVVATEQEEGDVAAHQGDRLDDRVGDADAGPRHQVVGERVAEEAVDDAQDEHGSHRRPVELPGLAERPGEEHPGHVHGDRAEEDVGRPVVGLAHEQSRPHVEGEPDGGGIGLATPARRRAVGRNRGRRSREPRECSRARGRPRWPAAPRTSRGRSPPA